MKKLLCVGGPYHGEMLDFPEHSTALKVLPKQSRPAYVLSDPLEPLDPIDQTGTYWPQVLPTGKMGRETVELLVWAGWDKL